jgi:hypothetical protein
MLLLAAHARNVTFKLFEGLKLFKDLDSMSSDIDEYVRYTILFDLLVVCLKRLQKIGEHCDVLEGKSGEEDMGASDHQAERRRRHQEVGEGA